MISEIKPTITVTEGVGQFDIESDLPQNSRPPHGT
jgi:hypothetical protein